MGKSVAFTSNASDSVEPDGVESNVWTDYDARADIKIDGGPQKRSRVTTTVNLGRELRYDYDEHGERIEREETDDEYRTRVKRLIAKTAQSYTELSMANLAKTLDRYPSEIPEWYFKSQEHQSEFKRRTKGGNNPDVDQYLICPTSKLKSLGEDIGRNLASFRTGPYLDTLISQFERYQIPNKSRKSVFTVEPVVIGGDDHCAQSIIGRFSLFNPTIQGSTAKFGDSLQYTLDSNGEVVHFPARADEQEAMRNWTDTYLSDKNFNTEHETKRYERLQAKIDGGKTPDVHTKASASAALSNFVTLSSKYWDDKTKLTKDEREQIESFRSTDTGESVWSALNTLYNYKKEQRERKVKAKSQGKSSWKEVTLKEPVYTKKSVKSAKKTLESASEFLSNWSASTAKTLAADTESAQPGTQGKTERTARSKSTDGRSTANTPLTASMVSAMA